MPTIGTSDTTAIGSDIAPLDIKALVGRYDLLGKKPLRASRTAS